MDQNHFDGLTRALAGSTSRRQALKLLGGGLLAALVPGSVFAKGGNSACANFCAQVFGANTREAGKCTSDAAKGKGMCYSACGPSGAGGKLCGQTCCTTSVANATATCSNGTCGFTCNDGYKECNGTCIPNDQCCGGCAAGQTCQGGTCVTALTVFECFCQTGGGGGFCQPLTCTPDNVSAFCGSVCADFGGSTARSNCQGYCVSS